MDELPPSELQGGEQQHEPRQKELECNYEI
jgi:hypothetical protein